MIYHQYPNNRGLLHGRTKGSAYCDHGLDRQIVDHAFTADDLRAIGVGNVRTHLGADGDVCVLCGGGFSALSDKGEEK